MSVVARARMEERLKNEAEEILKSIGLTSSDAIRLLYQQIVNRGTFPLELKTPNTVTQKAIDEARDHGDALESFDSFEDLLKEDRISAK